MIYSRATAGSKHGHWFMVAPPLTISEEECGELVRRIEATLSDFVQELRASGIL
jgi:acetylornithine/succinyldiaminopimelate/putrescine aminotransferase